MVSFAPHTVVAFGFEVLLMYLLSVMGEGPRLELEEIEVERTRSGKGVSD